MGEIKEVFDMDNSTYKMPQKLNSTEAPCYALRCTTHHHACDCREKMLADKIDELKHAIKCAEISLDGRAQRIEDLERVIADWLDCADTPSEWMRCRNNAKIALKRDARPKEYCFDRNDFVP